MGDRPTRREAVRLLAVGVGLGAGCHRAGGPAPDPDPDDGDGRLRYGPARSQFGELTVPDGPGPHPVAVAVHGGFWAAAYGLDHLRPFCAGLAAAGWAVWCPEYRRVGEPDGGWPNTLRDVGAAADHLRALAAEYRLDLGRVAAVGHSAGGHLALWLAARRTFPPDHPLAAPDPVPVRGAVALAGVCDLRLGHRLRLGGGAVARLLGGPPEAVPDRYAAASPAELVPLRVPQALVHGTADVAVPVAVSRAYRAAAAAAGDAVDLAELDGVDHFGLIDPESPAWPTVEAALAQFQ